MTDQTFDPKAEELARTMYEHCQPDGAIVRMAQRAVNAGWRANVTAEDVVRWLWDADHWQVQAVGVMAESIATARRAENRLLDTEDEPF